MTVDPAGALEQGAGMGLGVALVARRRRISALLPEWWLAACVLGLLIASDYRVRIRDPSMTLSGRPDAAVLIEIAVYGLVALVTLIAAAQPSQQPTNPRLQYTMWAVVGVLALASLYSPFGLFSIVRGAQLVVVAALAQVAGTRASMRHFAVLVRWFTLTVGLSVLVGILMPLDRPGAAGDRFSWLYVHPVIAGLYLALAVVFLVAHLTDGRNQAYALSWRPPVQWTLLVICFGGLLATQTRGSIGAAVLGCLVVYWSRSTPGQRIDLLVGVTVVGALALLVIGGVVVEFLQRGESLERIITLNARTELWAQMLRLWAERPLFGHGLGASRGLLLDETGLGGGHNVGVNLLVDVGAVGLVVWIVFLVALLRYLVVLSRNEHTRVVSSTLLGATVLLLVNGLTTEVLVVPATIASTWLLVIVAWALVLARPRPAGSS